MSNRLCEIPRNELPKLRDLYSKDWPKYSLAHYTINNYIKWFEQEPQINNIKIFSLDGDWSDGTYIIIDRYLVMCNTLNKSQDNMKIALSLLDYRSIRVFYGFPIIFKGIVEQLFDQSNLKARLAGKGNETAVYYLPKARAKMFELNLPPGIFLKPLLVDSSSIIDNLWPYQHVGSEQFIKTLIRFNSSVGAYSENGQLVAWCLMSPLGTLGLLQVRDSYKRQGLGSLLVKAMSKKLADFGYDICATVVLANNASRRMFENLGFVDNFVENIIWYHINTESENLEWKYEYDE